MNKHTAAKLSSLPCFEAFGVVFVQMFVQIVCSYFYFVCGGRGHSRVFEMFKFLVPQFPPNNLSLHSYPSRTKL